MQMKLQVVKNICAAARVFDSKCFIIFSQVLVFLLPPLLPIQCEKNVYELVLREQNRHEFT